MCALTQAARQGLSARIRFASANNMFNFAVCFRRPRYRVFRKRSCCFTTAKTCSTLARTEDFSRSLRLNLCSGSIGVVLALRWTTIDFVTNSLSGLITGNGLGAFLCSEIAAVSVDNLLLSGQKFCRHTDIVLVGRCHFQCVHNASFVGQLLHGPCTRSAMYCPF